jgi:hypothetical protein
VLVTSEAAIPPVPGTLTNNDPSPTNLFAVIEDAMIRCDDKKLVKCEPELIFRDETVLKLLR